MEYDFKMTVDEAGNVAVRVTREMPMEYDFKMTVDEADTLYVALKFYLDTHKERVNKLRNVDRDSLTGNDYMLVCNYDSISELINKFEDVEFSRPNLIKK